MACAQGQACLGLQLAAVLVIDKGCGGSYRECWQQSAERTDRCKQLTEACHKAALKSFKCHQRLSGSTIESFCYSRARGT